MSTTLPMEIIKAIEILIYPFKYVGVPVKEVSMILGISMQFIPIFVREIDIIKKAQIVRGARFESNNYIDKAKKIYADLSSDLLIAIFYEGNPLHDGGVIIQGDRITCAGAVFPTSSSPKINRRLGTRHRAALGLAEETDAICIVVSEETGRVSIALGGEMLYNLTLDDVRMMLIDELRPKQDIGFDEDEDVSEEDAYEENR